MSNIKKCLFCGHQMIDCGLDDNGSMQIRYYRCKPCNANLEHYISRHELKEYWTFEKYLLVSIVNKKVEDKRKELFFNFWDYINTLKRYGNKSVFLENLESFLTELEKGE